MQESLAIGKIQELEQANRDLRHFVHFASHDLQEPLRALSGYSKLLNEHLARNSDETAKKYLDQIGSAAGRMSRLLRDLLDYAQLSEAHWNPQKVSVATILNGVRADLAQEIHAAQARVERSELPWVVGDPVGLRLLVQALLSNAIKFRRGSHPHIEVGSYPSPGGITVWIRDDGVGIPPQYLKEVFQPFRRLHTLDEHPGSGLGLAMAARIAERHGGRVWIQPNDHFGVTACFELPEVTP